LRIAQKVRTNPKAENFDMTNEDAAATDNPPDNYFKEWRLHRGMTQAQVQQQLGWSDGRLSKMESGAVSAKPVALAALARLYGCEMGNLFEPPPVASSGSGLFGILEVRRLIARLQHDMAELKRVMIPRIEELERQLTEVDTASEAAVKNAHELAELFGYYASQMSGGTSARK